MKTLKSLAIAGLAFITFNLTAQERAHMDPQQMAQSQTDKIKKSVSGVTPDQESKILAVEQESAKAMQDARTSSNGDRDAMRTKMKSLREDRDAKIKGILNADQYAEYQRMQEAEKGQHGGGR
jgi:hypothetical protein